MFDKLDDFLNRSGARKRTTEGWTLEKIEAMSTKEILAHLNQIGITVTAQEFQALAQRHDSSKRLADAWGETYHIRPQGRYDQDFVWMAAFVLWKRLMPGHICFEQIDARMQEGYALLEQQRLTEACDAWWQTWTWIKEKASQYDTLRSLDQAFRGMQLIYNWCQDFEMHLDNAGAQDPQYYHLRIRYCQEFLACFKLEWDLRGNFMPKPTGNWARSRPPRPGSRP